MYKHAMIFGRGINMNVVIGFLIYVFMGILVFRIAGYIGNKIFKTSKWLDRFNKNKKTIFIVVIIFMVIIGIIYIFSYRSFHSVLNVDYGKVDKILISSGASNKIVEITDKNEINDVKYISNRSIDKKQITNIEKKYNLLIQN